jgi:hypothetical protein
VKVETLIFAAGSLFFAPMGALYGVITKWEEPVGVIGLFLSTGLSLLITLYFWLTSRRIDARPEDNKFAEVSDGAGDLGAHFPPYSWWPLWAGLGSAATFAGLAVGWWLFFIGAALTVFAAVGWVFEYYRGEYAH